MVDLLPLWRWAGRSSRRYLRALVVLALAARAIAEHVSAPAEGEVAETEHTKPASAVVPIQVLTPAPVRLATRQALQRWV